HARMGAAGGARGGWRCCRRSVSPLFVATCAGNYCATRCSISPLLYPQLLATKEITSRHTVGVSWQVGFADAAKHPKVRLEQRKQALGPVLMHLTARV